MTPWHDGVMNRWVALLRAVNVGGVRVAMADLRTAAAALGYTDVANYLQSGNLTFCAARADRAELRQAIEAETGVDTEVIVLDADQWRAVVVGNPFDEVTDPTRLHVVVGQEDFTPENAAAAKRVRAALTETADEVAVVGRAMYLSLPDGMGRSTLAERLWRSKETGHHAATTRNWRTVLALHERLQEPL